MKTNEKHVQKNQLQQINEVQWKHFDVGVKIQNTGTTINTIPNR